MIVEMFIIADSNCAATSLSMVKAPARDLPERNDR
jgi:hypothetical protein